ncbi:MAG TPA: GAF domain-containing sensor histidine kinase [Caulobacteraceae bacterium]|jgi:signal transduction histidine kinase
MEARSKVAGRVESHPRPSPSDAANLLLQEGIDRLGTTADIDGFLADLLRATRNLLGGHSASIWRRDARDPEAFRLEVSLETDTVTRGGAPTGDRGSAASRRQDAAPTPWVELSRVGQGDLPCQLIIVPDGQAESEDALLHQAGVRSTVIIDLVLADISLGVLIVRLAHQRPVLHQHRRLIERLAQRSAMALHLCSFATAKARAEKLALANALLRETSERLGAVEDLDAFLGRVLLTMYEVVGGHSATLWLVDPERPHHYTIHHVVENGRLVPGTQSTHPRRETGSTPTPRRQSDPRLYGPASKPHMVDLTVQDGLMHEDERLYLLGLGVRQLLSVPLGLGDRVLGRFTIRLADARQILEEELDLIQALAGQAAVALDLARLAEEAKQAAVGREREAAERDRADAVHRANEVLRAMLERLSEQQDLPAFLGDVLRVCAREMDAVGVGVWIRRGPGEHGLLISWHGGEIRRPAEGDFLARLTTMGHLDRDLSRGEIAFVKLADFDDLIDEWGPTLRGAIEVDHVRTAAQVPMFIGDRWLGTLVFRHSSESPHYPPERRELALAFGNQIALALEMQRLAATAREAALSEERASAARQRTEAAERTAETLRASLDMLAAEPELERFLGYVLRSANTHLDVRRSTLWIYEPERGMNRLHMTCDEGVVTVEPDTSRTVFPTGEWPFWRRLIENGGPLAFDDAAHNPDLIQDRVKRFGIRSLLVVPLMLGPEVLGAIGIHNTERESWTEDEVSLARALGHQATLALQLTRLATKAREGAVLQERNRLAREIHDTLAQGFAAIRMQLELARGDPATAGEALDLANKIAEENLIEARRSMAVLTAERPSLIASLSAAIEGVRRLGQTQVVAQIDAAPEPPPEVAHELLRICQEAMLNAVRHAEASTVRITVAAIHGHGVRIAVEDDGIGFDPGAVTKGFGLAGLRDRASAIDAHLTIVSEPGAGTEVIATWAPA